jgi:plasmid stabilization system protein ParE
VTRTIHRDAEADLAAAVRHYKSEAGVGVARRFVSEFERLTRLLEQNSRLGTPGDHGRRCFPLAVFPKRSSIGQQTRASACLLCGTSGVILNSAHSAADLAVGRANNTFIT